MFSEKEKEIIDEAFEYYSGIYIIGRDLNCYILGNLFAINAMGGKVDDDGRVAKQ